MKKQISTPAVVAIVLGVVVAVIAFGFYSIDRSPPLPTTGYGGPPNSLRALHEGKGMAGGGAHMMTGKFMGK
jgi:hypothetical protein